MNLDDSIYTLAFKLRKRPKPVTPGSETGAQEQAALASEDAICHELIATMAEYSSGWHFTPIPAQQFYGLILNQAIGEGANGMETTITLAKPAQRRRNEPVENGVARANADDDDLYEAEFKLKKRPKPVTPLLGTANGQSSNGAVSGSSDVSHELSATLAKLNGNWSDLALLDQEFHDFQLKVNTRQVADAMEVKISLAPRSNVPANGRSNRRFETANSAVV